MNSSATNECLINGVQYKCRTCFVPGNELYSLNDNCGSAKTWRDVLNEIDPLKVAIEIQPNRSVNGSAVSKIPRPSRNRSIVNNMVPLMLMIKDQELLPKTICNICFEKLFSYYYFPVQIQNVNKKYYELLANLKDNNPTGKVEHLTEVLTDPIYELLMEDCITDIKLENEYVFPYDITVKQENMDSDGEFDDASKQRLFNEEPKLVIKKEKNSSSSSEESYYLVKQTENTDDVSSEFNMDFVEDSCVLLDESESEHSNCTQTTPAPKKRKKPSVISSWTRDEINCLILSIEEQPCIWEYSCLDYKDRYKREQAWRRIQLKCRKHSVDDCKGKWANLKTAFQNVQKKFKAKSCQDADNEEPHWPYWSAMQFITRDKLPKTICSESKREIIKDTYLEKKGGDEKPGCSKTNNFLPLGEKKQIDIMKRAVKYLETEEDNWHVIGMYLASQMRELAQTNRKSANKLHMQLIKTVMEVLEAVDN